MNLSPTEQSREDMQRRQSDAWIAIKQAEIQQRNATMTAVGTMLGLACAGAWWLSQQAADDAVAPVKLHVNTNAERIQANADEIEDTKQEFGEFKVVMQKNNDILMRLEGKLDK
jgi:HAMP domain-containing protein